MAEKRGAGKITKKKDSDAKPKAKPIAKEKEKEKAVKEAEPKKKIAVPKAAKPKASTKVKEPSATLRKKESVDSGDEKKSPRVEVIKKSDVLKRMAEEAAREAALKETLEKESQAREEALKKVNQDELLSKELSAKIAPKGKVAAEETHTPPPPPKEITGSVGVSQESAAETKAKAMASLETPVKATPTKVEPPVVEPKASPPPAPPKREIPPPVSVAPPKGKSKTEPPKVDKAKEEAVRVAVVTEEAPPAELLPLSKVQVSFPVTLGELAPKVNKTPNELIKLLMQKGMMMTINQRLDEESAKKIALGFGFELDVVDPLELESQLEEKAEDPAKLKPRPPVVTVMGHVDHGKTSLLDAIRRTNVTASEEGGITQRIGAYQVELNGRKITFLDTPGHEAFTAMRARGTKITDVAILVVAADDGVMPQTLEAIDHARAANVPIVIAINKVDKPNSNVDRVKQQLSDHGLIPEEWGGTTVFVPVSAKQKTGIEELLEMILLVADLAEVKANPDKMARGTIIEAKLDRGKGPVATALIQEGTFRIGDAFVAGNTYGKIRAFINDRGERIEEAPPSFPVEIIGLNDVPEAGDSLQVVVDDKVARQIAEARALHSREQTLASLKRVTLDDLYQQIKEGEIKDLNLIMKADGQGSVEALKDALERLTTDEIRIRVIHTGVGTITESDVMLAAASNAIIIGFNIRPEPHIKNIAEREKVDLRFYRIIYQAIEDITQAMVGMRKPMYREAVSGRAEILQTFKISKVGVIAGCKVTDGKIIRDAEVRVLRDGAVVYEGKIASLKRFKDDVREVIAGFECGMAIEKFNDVKVGDVFEAYVIEEVKHTTLAGKSEG